MWYRSSLLLLIIFLICQYSFGQDISTIYTIVDQPAHPDYDLNAYFSNATTYTEKAKQAGIEGRVVLKFVVNEVGKTSKVSVIKSLEPGLDSQAVKAINTMPAWVPAVKDGKKVNMYFTQPVSFRLKPLDSTLSDKVYNSTQIPAKPKFDLNEYLLKHLNYPQKSIESFLEGIVKIRFIVDTDGNISDVKVVQHVTDELDTAAIAIVQRMPKWTPGQIGNENVNSYVLLPVNFSLFNLPSSVFTSCKPVDSNAVFDSKPHPGYNLSAYLQGNIHYPPYCMYHDIEGRVLVSFIVETDGSITNVKVKKGVHRELDLESVRVISEMPKWVPGAQKDTPVRFEFTQPITFRL